MAAAHVTVALDLPAGVEIRECQRHELLDRLRA
jgi:hypothetical protein